MAIQLANGDALNLASPAVLDNLAEATIIAVVWRDGSGNTDQIYNKSSAIVFMSMTGADALELSANTDNTGSGEITTAIIGNLSDFAAYGTGKWLFVAGKYKQGDVGGVLADNDIFIGDYLGASAAPPSGYILHTAGVGSKTDDSAGDLVVGSNPALTNAFGGRLAFLGIWNRALTDEEIVAQQLVPHPTPGCVYFAHVNAVDDIVDEVNGITATVVGSPTNVAHAPYSLPMFPPVDDFATDQLALTFPDYYESASTISITGGRCRFNWPASTPGTNFAGLKSAFGDFTGESTYIELATLHGSSNNLLFWFTVGPDNSNLVYFSFVGHNLYVAQRVAGTQTILADLGIVNLSSYKFLRIRESGGTTFWESSVDGNSWTVRHSAANPIALANAFVEVGGGTNASVASPGFTEVDGVNATSTAAAQLHGVSTFDPAEWATDIFNGTNSTRTHTADEFTVHPLAGVGGENYEGIRLTTGRDWTEDGGVLVRVDFSNATPTSNSEASFEVWQDNDNFARMYVIDTTLYMRHRVAGSQVITTITYSPTDHKYWRITRSGSDVLYQTSPDGSAWTTRRTEPFPAAWVGPFHPGVYAGVFGAHTPVGTISFFELNDVQVQQPPDVVPDPGEPVITLDDSQTFQTWRGLIGHSQAANLPVDWIGADPDAYLPEVYARVLQEVGLAAQYVEVYAATQFDQDQWLVANEASDETNLWVPHRHTSKLASGGQELYFHSQTLLAVDNVIAPTYKLATALGLPYQWGIRFGQYWGQASQDHTGKYRMRDFPDRLARMVVDVVRSIKAHTTTPDFPNGLLPSWIEVCNEPDHSATQWSITQLASNTKAVADALIAAGFNIPIWGPSTEHPVDADNYWDGVWDHQSPSFPNRAYLDVLAYHRYTNPPEGNQDIINIAQRRASDGVETYMAEFTNSTIRNLWSDLKDAQVSWWSPFVTAFGWNNTTAPDGPKGGQYVGVARFDDNGYTTGDVEIGINASAYRIFSRYVRPGMVRKGFSLTNATTSQLDCLPWVDNSGRWAVFIRSKAAQDIWITNLPVGTYHVNRVRATVTNPDSNSASTNLIEGVTALSDVAVVTFGDSVQIAGATNDAWYIVYDETISVPADAVGATTPPKPPVPAAPSNNANLSGTVEFSWGAITDPAGGAVTYKGLKRPKVGPSRGAAWTELFPEQSGTTVNINTLTLANGPWEWAIIAISSTGLESRLGIWQLRTQGQSGYFSFSVSNAAGAAIELPQIEFGLDMGERQGTTYEFNDRVELDTSPQPIALSGNIVVLPVLQFGLDFGGDEQGPGRPQLVARQNRVELPQIEFGILFRGIGRPVVPGNPGGGLAGGPRGIGFRRRRRLD